MYLGYEYYQRETINKSLLEKAYKIIEHKKTIVAAEEGIALRHVLSPDMEYCLVEFHDGIKKIELNVHDKDPNLCYIGKKADLYMKLFLTTTMKVTYRIDSCTTAYIKEISYGVG